jgi:hypothetical protein
VFLAELQIFVGVLVLHPHILAYSGRTESLFQEAKLPGKWGIPDILSSVDSTSTSVLNAKLCKTMNQQASVSGASAVCWYLQSRGGVNHSILWMILQGIVSWFYVLYYGFLK